MELVAVTLLLLYLGHAFLLWLGTFRLRYATTERLPSVSILVALRNEAPHLDRCVASLLALDYPEELVEIWLINDRSTDRTPERVEAWRQRCHRIRTLHIRHGTPGLSGKANALAQALDRCTGEIVLVTDGDCVVPSTWARAHVRYYTADVGMVAGFTLLDRPGERTTLFGKIQSLDWAYLLAVGAGALGLGLPLSVLGNNFSFRRAAYHQVGGYRRMGFTIIEDFALMKHLVKQTDWRVCYPVDPTMLVYSRPMPRLRDFYAQRKRWAAGGKEVPLYGKLLMAVACFAHALLPLAWVTSAAWWPAAGVGLLVVADFALLWRVTGLVQRRDLLRAFPLWEPFYFGYTCVFAPVLLFPTRVNWKGTVYTWRFGFRLKSVTQLESSKGQIWNADNQIPDPKSQIPGARNQIPDPNPRESNSEVRLSKLERSGPEGREQTAGHRSPYSPAR